MTVKRVDVTDATKSLAYYVREADSSPLVVISDGRPVAALISLEDTDLETVALSTNPDFLALIQESRARHQEEGGLSSAEVRRRLGVAEQ
jgi:PHD/YefM family antitoxin component YafN of YafNO toxin-antitoxin module